MKRVEKNGGNSMKKKHELFEHHQINSNQNFKGCLWRFVRASMSLSGYMPPICDPKV